MERQMTKFLNKWTRKFHRWIAIPMILIIPIAVIAKFTGGAFHLPRQIEQLQSILMLLLVISGAYLYLVPYIARWQRGRRAKAQVAVRVPVAKSDLSETEIQSGGRYHPDHHYAARQIEVKEGAAP
jgi:quinol-cytochrome oxidoreductase complex cytochrome b subunit